MTTRAPWPAIESLIPHRAPMLFVEGVVERLDDGIVCRGRIPSDGPLAKGGVAPLVLGVELAAQTAAVLEALNRRQAEGEEASPRIGYLATIREARFHVPELPAGKQLLASVRRIGGVGSLAMYEAKVVLSGDPSELLTATLSTYLAE